MISLTLYIIRLLLQINLLLFIDFRVDRDPRFVTVWLISTANTLRYYLWLLLLSTGALCSTCDYIIHISQWPLFVIIRVYELWTDTQMIKKTLRPETPISRYSWKLGGLVFINDEIHTALFLCSSHGKTHYAIVGGKNRND